MNENALKGQIAGAAVDVFNSIRLEHLNDALAAINEQLSDSLSAQGRNFAKAIERMDIVQKFIEHPETILGRMDTKHGEIAEQLEVGITNAKQALHGLEDIATADPAIVGRTTNAPADYLINGVQVQSKFINSPLHTLDHVLNHLEKYEDIGFGKTDASMYHIPKDQYQRITKILEDKDAYRLGSREERHIIEKIREIEKQSGRKFKDLVKPAHADYDDVQWGRIQDTIDSNKSELVEENRQIKDEYQREADADTAKAVMEHKASFGEAVKAAGVAAAVSGSITLSTEVYKKKKAGIKLTEFTAEDWKEIGLKTGGSAGKGGISGFAIYGLTNLTCMSAPLASGYVSGAFGIVSLLRDYRNGESSFEDFIESSEMLCMDTAVVTAGSIIGQALIPIPGLGMIIGGFASNIAFDIIKKYCSQKELEYLTAYRERKQFMMQEQKDELHVYVREMLSRYQELGQLASKAFDFDVNYQVRFEASKELALSVGVANNEILSTEEEIDSFFTD